jgi:hypothetical protein
MVLSQGRPKLCPHMPRVQPHSSGQIRQTETHPKHNFRVSHMPAPASVSHCLYFPCPPLASSLPPVLFLPDLFFSLHMSHSPRHILCPCHYQLSPKETHWLAGRACNAHIDATRVPEGIMRVQVLSLKTLGVCRYCHLAVNLEFC